MVITLLQTHYKNQDAVLCLPLNSNSLLRAHGLNRMRMEKMWAFEMT